MAKRTVFQRLNTIFGPEGVRQNQITSNKYSMSNDILLKTQSKEEYDSVKLQNQQNKYLRNVWKKVDGELFQQSIHYETTRIGSYTDFESMEFYPEISAALDVIMEESTTTNNFGKILNVYSDSNRIKGVLEDLFFNRLDIHVSLPMWVRNLAKYGDNFILLNLDNSKGVLGARQLPNFEIERREGDILDAMISARNRINVENVSDESSKVKFFWRGRDVEFNSWQIGHFRLLGDDRRLPYGVSVLEKARRVWKQLNLAEDAMLVYRLTRAPERRIYKIFVGNIDEEDVPSYVDEIANRFKRTPIIDPKTGQIDVRYNTMPVWKNTPIPLLDGRTITIEELAKEYDNGKENWVYSIQDDTHQVVGGKVAWCGKNYTADRMVKVWLDDDTYIVTAEEHPFVMRDGTKKRADELKENDSLMPFYIKESNYEDGMRISGYPMVYNPKSSIYEFTHRIIGETILSEEKKLALETTNFYENNNLTIHHKDFTKTNSNPDNLLWIGNVDHIMLHSKRGAKILTEYNKSEKKREQNRIRGKEEQWHKRFEWYNSSELHKEHNEIRREAQIKDWSNPEKKNARSKSMRIKFDDFVWDNIRTNIVSKNIFNRKSLLEFLNTENMLNHVISINKNDRLNNQRKIERTVVERLINENGFNTITEYIDANKKNHKVKSIEFIGGDDVYCMTVLGKNGEDDRHNFALYSFNSNGEQSNSGVFVGNSNDQDFFIPVRDENAPSPIDTLPGACIALDTRIPLLDGRTLELQEIIEEWNSGNRDLWVYSCNPETGELAPGMITWAGETRKNTEVIKITLDNGESLITTPDHKWVHRTKGFVEAKDLIVGDSLMPFYRDTKKIKSNTNDYEVIWDSYKQEWIYTHRMVTDVLDKHNIIETYIFDEKYNGDDKNIRHHKDHNRFNNNPSNLVWMNGADHIKYHQSVIMETIWGNPKENIEKISKGLNRYISNLTEEEKQLRGNQSKLNSINSRDKANETFKNNLNRTEVIKNRGEKISIAKSTEEFKEKFSEIAKTNWQSEEYRNKVFSKKQTLTFTDELYTMFFEMFKIYGKADLTLNELNHSNDFMNEFINSNKDIRSSLTNLNEFTHKHLEKMLKEKGFKNYREWCKVTAEELGYKNVRAWRYFIEKNKNSSEFYNHKITSIEWLENKIDTGTITVDGDEIYHNYHTFATESGVFIKNSNLDQIADIQYLQRKLFTALRVPKQFLNFDEAQGEGKNLSLQDVRFSRTINRIQQAVLAELNKIAIIHLVLLGFEDDLDNFTLTMNNPSTQAEMMKIEQMQMKVTLFKDAVSDSGNGFATMSMTRAHREILGWSDDEIKQDLLEQRIEKAAAAEMENTSNVIKYTGMFDKVDSIYGDIEAAKAGGTPSESGDEEGGGPTGGGGGSFGGGGLEFGGDEGGDEVPEEGADETPEPETGGETPEAVPPLAESVNKKKVITERVLSGKVKKPINKQVYSNSFDDLMNSIKNKDEDKVLNERVKVYDKSLKINEDINNIINNIDKMLDE